MKINTLTKLLKNKKIFVFVSLFFVIQNVFYANTVLSLCDKALDNNLNIKQAKMNAQKALKTQKTMFLNYLPQINFFSGINYTQNNFDLAYPESGSIYGSLSEYLPFGASLQIKPSFYYVKTNSKENDYEGVTTLDVQYSQSLLPSWVNLCIKNPETYLVKINTKSSDYALLSKEYEILDSVLAIILQIRSNERKLLMAKYNVELYTTRFEAIKEMALKGDQSRISYFSERQNLINAKNTLESVKETKKSIFCNLQELIGFCLDEDCIDTLYSQILKDESWATDFNRKYWYWNYNYAWNIQFKQSELQEESLKHTYFLEKQSYAPKLLVSLSTDYNSEQKHSFEANIGFDLSDCFTSKTLELKKDYKKQSSLLKEQKGQSKKLYNELLSSYNLNLKNITEKNESLEKELKELEIIFNDYSELYKEKKCSYLDFLEIRNSYFQMKIELENNTDSLDYYKLLLNCFN